MYTVVLMTALTAGDVTPDHFFRGGCRGFLGGHSCSGGCYGYSNGCYGSGCYGSGCYGRGGCFGWGAWGGCSGGGGNGCCGGGGCYGAYGAGCTGGYGCYGSGAYVMPVDQGRPAMPSSEGQTQQVRAQVTIDVPPEAKLFIDGNLMKSGSGRRVFETPALTPGQVYYYEVRVELVRNGQTLSDTQRVVLRPGQAASASFAHLERQGNDTATAQAK
jgi:uncharacterized protein (TIGR03000 family)